MEISIKEHKRAAVVEASGRIDSSTAGEFEEALTQAMENGHKNLVLDLAEVDFLSSAGLRAMVNARKSLQAMGGNLCLAQPSERVVDTLEIAGLHVLFNSYPDRESAIGAF